jgi:hypothetical protein
VAAESRQDETERCFTEHTRGAWLWTGWQGQRRYEAFSRHAALYGVATLCWHAALYRDTTFRRDAAFDRVSSFSQHTSVDGWRSFLNHFDRFVGAFWWQ